MDILVIHKRLPQISWKVTLQIKNCRRQKEATISTKNKRGGSGPWGREFKSLRPRQSMKRQWKMAWKLTKPRPNPVLNLEWLATSSRCLRILSWNKKSGAASYPYISLALMKWFEISVLLGDITFRAERGLISIWRKECGPCLYLQYQSACSCSLPWRARTCSSRTSIQMSWATWVSRRNHDRGYPSSPLARCENHASGFFVWVNHLTQYGYVFARTLLLLVRSNPPCHAGDCFAATPAWFA